MQDSLTENFCVTFEKITRSQKNNKARDGTGLSAEHLKYGGKPLSVFIARELNDVFRRGKVPELFKMGYITPIYNKQGEFQISIEELQLLAL